MSFNTRLNLIASHWKYVCSLPWFVCNSTNNKNTIIECVIRVAGNRHKTKNDVGLGRRCGFETLQTLSYSVCILYDVRCALRTAFQHCVYIGIALSCMYDGFSLLFKPYVQYYCSELTKCKHPREKKVIAC